MAGGHECRDQSDRFAQMLDRGHRDTPAASTDEHRRGDLDLATGRG